MTPAPRPESKLLAHQEACRACTRCVEDGIIPRAAPVFSGQWGASWYLCGQAPGPTESGSRRPFSGRAGKELDRWMLRAGFASAEEFRRVTYIASLMRCFPGRRPGGGGDQPPQSRGVDNCAQWMEAEFAMLRPKVVILVGQMAITRFLGPGRLEDRVGRAITVDGRAHVPLPHPSGQSRWLNDDANRARLAAALELLSDFRLRLLASR